MERGPLSYQLLETAYQSACYGRWEPQVLRASALTVIRVREFLGETYAKYEVSPLLFHEAVIVIDTALPDNVLIFDQAKYPSLVFLNAAD